MSPCDKMDWMTFNFRYDTPGTVGDVVTFKLDLRGAGSNGLPTSTLYAQDTLNFTASVIGSPGVFKSYGPTDFPNITAYSIPAATNLSLVLHGASSNLLSIQRASSTNATFTVTTFNGYKNVGFVNNNAVYAGSLYWSFGNSL